MGIFVHLLVDGGLAEWTSSFIFLFNGGLAEWTSSFIFLVMGGTAEWTSSFIILLMGALLSGNALGGNAGATFQEFLQHGEQCTAAGAAR